MVEPGNPYHLQQRVLSVWHWTQPVYFAHRDGKLSFSKRNVPLVLMFPKYETFDDVELSICVYAKRNLLLTSEVSVLRQISS